MREFDRKRVQPEQPMEPEMQAMILTAPEDQERITVEDIQKAATLLTEYKNGKANLEKRIVEDELWWELRHWEVLRKDKDQKLKQKPTSAWLFNTIMNKHADAMDNIPEPVALPREKDDEETAKNLSAILPVVMEYNEFEQTYSDNWWEKLKHGTACYGVFWDAKKDNGLGDIEIREIDLLKVFWEPGIQDIQDSRNLFIVELVDEEALDREYPEHAGKMGGDTITLSEYQYDDTVDTSKKSLVVDWYYKRQTVSGQQVLHYVKFVGNTLLYASENDPEYRDVGWYAHGRYPVVMDTLYPEKGTPVGFGIVSVCRDPQMYIDQLSSFILENAQEATNRRYFVGTNTGISEAEFLDTSKKLIHVESSIDERNLKEVAYEQLGAVYLNVLQMKIEEMKDTASNRDVNSGSAGSGVTAAAAIAALQEAGNKTSRDMISASYRAYVQISTICVELMRQFYDATRTFRITGEGGNYEFKEFNNKSLIDQPIAPGYPEEALADGYVPAYRRPVFDVKVKAQKKSPFSRMEQNERAKELYAAGFFAPERAQEAMGALEMMDFEGIDKVKDYVREGQTLMNIVQQMSAQMDQMAVLLQALTGKDMGLGLPQPQQGGKTPDKGKVTSNPVADGVMQAQTPMTDYGTRLAKRSAPDMNSGSAAATPKV
jgi:hypothetical protein